MLYVYGVIYIKYTVSTLDQGLPRDNMLRVSPMWFRSPNPFDQYCGTPTIGLFTKAMSSVELSSKFKSENVSEALRLFKNLILSHNVNRKSEYDTFSGLGN